MSMQKEVMQMDGKSFLKDSSATFHPALKFMYWQKFCWDTENLPIGFINSTMMEKRNLRLRHGHLQNFQVFI